VTPWSDDAALDLMNVKYAAAAVTSRPSNALAATEVGLELRERFGYLPRAVVFSSARVLEAAGGLSLPEFDYRTEVLLEEDPRLVLPAGGERAPSRAEILRYESDEIVIDVDTSTNAILFLSEVWYPAWVARVDGRRRPVLRANGCLRAVAVEGGRHTVIFRYESETFRRGAAISLGTVAAIIAAALGSSVMTRRRRGAH
jgi:hypothetical protein